MNSERDIQVKRLNPTSVMNPDNRSLHIGFFRLMFMGFGIKTVNLKKKSKKICLEEIQSGSVVWLVQSHQCMLRDRKFIHCLVIATGTVLLLPCAQSLRLRHTRCSENNSSNSVHQKRFTGSRSEPRVFLTKDTFERPYSVENNKQDDH